MTREELSKFAKRRLLPLAFLTAIALIANSTCHKSDRIHATVVLDLGAAADRVRDVQAQVEMNADIVGTFHKASPAGERIGACKFPVSLPAKDAVVHIDVDLGNGDVRSIDRALHADENATITVPLASDLQ